MYGVVSRNLDRRGRLDTWSGVRRVEAYLKYALSFKGLLMEEDERGEDHTGGPDAPCCQI